jgi:hypothetical protein
MGHGERLMAFQSEVPQGGVYDVVPLLAGEVLARGERDGKVLDRILNPGTGSGSNLRTRCLPPILTRTREPV